jgi:outer membrane protein assembly factor BamB
MASSLRSSIAAILVVAAPAVARAENWSCWRGPRLDGTSLEANAPIHWSGTSNVAWKTELPGLGHASPIVWEDRVFTVACLPESKERVLLCLDRPSGKVLWQRVVIASPLEQKHSLNSHASSTPATDGELVYVTFLDRREIVVAAYDFAGKQRWVARPGEFSSMHGFCSSPILHDELLIVNGDHDGDSYIVALHRVDGKTVWKTPRESKTRSYCVPLIRGLSGRTQMILSGGQVCRQLRSGTAGIGSSTGPPTSSLRRWCITQGGSPVRDRGYPDHHIRHQARRPRQHHRFQQDRVAHEQGRRLRPVPHCGGRLFPRRVSDSGVAHCFEAKTGRIAWQERLGEHHASLVSANGLVYFLNDVGVMNVVKPGSEFLRVAKNELGERTFASPAISQGQIILRGDKHLFCIGTR